MRSDSERFIYLSNIEKDSIVDPYNSIKGLCDRNGFLKEHGHG